MSQLRFSPTLQRAIRQDPPQDLGRPTRVLLEEAVVAGRTGEAMDWLNYLLVEIGGIHYLLGVWNWQMVHYYLDRQGSETWAALVEASLAPWVGATYGLAGEPAAQVTVNGSDAVLTVPDLPLPVWLREGDKRYHVSLDTPVAQKARQAVWRRSIETAIAGGELAEFTRLLDERLAEDRFIHDVLSDWCWALMTILMRTWGEDALGEIQRATEEPWVTVRYAALRNLTPEESLQLSVEAHRGHFAGPSREGSVSVIDEPERYIIELSPCGSGARMALGDPTVGNGSRLLPPYEFAVVAGAYPWTWGRPGVGAYCSHCAIVNQILPIEWLGSPMRGTDRPRDMREPCRWFIYKSRQAVPDEQFTNVGKTRPASGGS